MGKFLERIQFVQTKYNFLGYLKKAAKRWSCEMGIIYFYFLILPHAKCQRKSLVMKNIIGFFRKNDFKPFRFC